MILCASGVANNTLDVHDIQDSLLHVPVLGQASLILAVNAWLFKITMTYITLSQEKCIKTHCTKCITCTIFVMFHIMLQCNANTIKQIGYV